MDWLSELPLIKFLVAFAIVFVLIIATFWLLRRFGGTRLGSTAARGRQPRLAVIDAAAVDGRRRLVLIRRDNVEHLVMIGGPSDVIIEQNIVRAVPVASAREMPRVAGQGEARPDAAPPRAEPAPSWQQTETPRPQRSMPTSDDMLWATPEPATRAPRSEPPRIESPRTEPQLPRGEPMPRADAPMRPEPRPERKEPRQSPPDIPPVRPPTPAPAAKQAAEPLADPRTPPLAPDANLADMAQRLEAALRRPIPVGDRRGAEPAPAKAAPGTESASSRPPAAPAPAPAPSPAAPSPAAPEASASEPTPPPGAPARKPQADAKPASPKSVLDSLEAEMANLLGRPAGKE